jgi:hypothetical protein
MTVKTKMIVYGVFDHIASSFWRYKVTADGEVCFSEIEDSREDCGVTLVFLG